MNPGDSFYGMLSNKWVKIVVATFFFIFIYKIIYQIGIFLGWDEFILDSYMLWLAILIILITILPINRSIL